MSAQQYVRPHSKLEKRMDLGWKNVLLKTVLLLIQALVWSPAQSYKQLRQHNRGAIGGGGGREDEILKICSQEQAMQNCVSGCI